MIVDPDAYLSHYGVLGMKWGIRKDRSGQSGSKASTMADDLKSDSSYGELLNRKYGPDSMGEMPKPPLDKEPGWKGLTPAQKKVAIAVGSAVLIGVAVYAGKKYLDADAARALAEQANYERLKIERLKEAQDYYKDIASKPIKDLNVALATHWDKGVDLEAGTVVRRLTTKVEKTVRPSGFFAAYTEADVERYKAELPVWWERWGFKEKSGYLTELKAKGAVKAPSGKESVEIFKRLIDTDPKFAGAIRKEMGGKAPWEGLTGSDRAAVIDGVGKKMFPRFSAYWCNGLDSHHAVQSYFDEVRKAGFNALIDFNDSGKLSRDPLRLLDGTNFDIVGNPPVSNAEIKRAQKALKPLVMSLLKVFGVSIDEMAYLQHYRRMSLFYDSEEVLYER